MSPNILVRYRSKASGKIIYFISTVAKIFERAWAGCAPGPRGLLSHSCQFIFPLFLSNRNTLCSKSILRTPIYKADRNRAPYRLTKQMVELAKRTANPCGQKRTSQLCRSKRTIRSALQQKGKWIGEFLRTRRKAELPVNLPPPRKGFTRAPRNVGLVG